MVTTFAILVLLGDLDWPPAPDFKTRIDYPTWIEARVRRDSDARENAWSSYRKIFLPQPNATSNNEPSLGFAGFRTDSDARHADMPQPWDPSAHPGWESSYQSHRELLKTFTRAAAQPYYLPDTNTLFAKGKPKLLFNTVLYDDFFKECTQGLSEAAWRAPEGKVDASAFIAACKAALQAARQLERWPLIATQLRAMSIRSVVYDDLCHALHYRLFSGQELRAARDMLSSIDTPPPPLGYALTGELAGIYDLLQHSADPNQPLPAVETVDDLVPLLRVGWIKPRQTAEVFHKSYQAQADYATLPYNPEKVSQIDWAADKWNRTNAFTSTLMRSLGRPYELHCQVEASRRATHVLYALHEYRNQHGQWPAKLDELVDERLPANTLKDPFGDQPFIYKLHDQKPLLYSHGLDGDDDGGRHHRRWGRGVTENADDGDYVFWPIPTIRPPK